MPGTADLEPGRCRRHASADRGGGNGARAGGRRSALPLRIFRHDLVIVSRSVRGRGIRVRHVQHVAATDESRFPGHHGSVPGDGISGAQHVITGRAGNHRPGDQHRVVSRVSGHAGRRGRDVARQLEPEVIHHEVIAQAGPVHVDGDRVLTCPQKTGREIKAFVGERSVNRRNGCCCHPSRQGSSRSG